MIWVLHTFIETNLSFKRLLHAQFLSLTTQLWLSIALLKQFILLKLIESILNLHLLHL